MTNVQTFTSSLPVSLIKYLNRQSEKTGLQKNKILEKALILYIEENRKRIYEESFRRALNDKEVVGMSDEGLNDYLAIITK